MTDFLAQLITWINIPVNTVGKFLLAPVGVLPGWLSNTIISAVTGVFLLIIFKYTSNQKAIGRVRDDIKAHMLALKLFKDSLSVTLCAQGHVFKGAFLLLFHAVIPMLIMIVPVCLLLGQLGLWYQSKPLSIGQEALVTIKFSSNAGDAWQNVIIEPTSVIDITAGPTRVYSKKEAYWKIKGYENGCHYIVFHIDGQRFEKELTIGDGFMRVSSQRPGWRWADILLHPQEKPFRTDSIIQSISIEYPERDAITSGTDFWLVYFFIASMVFALIFKPFLKVKI
ncbi:MAG: hypothetical protein ACYSTX_05490 [Planctomycetota bacterium]